MASKKTYITPKRNKRIYREIREKIIEISINNSKLSAKQIQKSYLRKYNNMGGNI